MEAKSGKFNFLVKIENGERKFIKVDKDYGDLYLTSSPAPINEDDLVYTMKELQKVYPREMHGQRGEKSWAVQANIHRVSEMNWKKDTAEFEVSLLEVDFDTVKVSTIWTWKFKTDLENAKVELDKE